MGTFILISTAGCSNNDRHSKAAEEGSELKRAPESVCRLHNGVVERDGDDFYYCMLNRGLRPKRPAPHISPTTYYGHIVKVSPDIRPVSSTEYD
ncbi:hypothetical protein GWI33_017124 [Rhynchophorus ferrugineus]|uniref:Uncharacterized protein n=1 Tax=Rhynchophorus ferrugineus TaxID=354439 RepID=A0A834HZM8_RHYFE|nr:hypothetical protein GWI33_017124 [Rhynchophorus ferrugineus]